jgi:hypothetical protein
MLMWWRSAVNFSFFLCAACRIGHGHKDEVGSAKRGFVRDSAPAEEQLEAVAAELEQRACRSCLRLDRCRNHHVLDLLIGHSVP